MSNGALALQNPLHRQYGVHPYVVQAVSLCDTIWWEQDQPSSPEPELLDTVDPTAASPLAAAAALSAHKFKFSVITALIAESELVICVSVLLHA